MYGCAHDPQKRRRGGPEGFPKNAPYQRGGPKHKVRYSNHSTVSTAHGNSRTFCEKFLVRLTSHDYKTTIMLLDKSSVGYKLSLNTLILDTGKTSQSGIIHNSEYNYDNVI